jgi:hypothetical protein
MIRRIDLSRYHGKELTDYLTRRIEALEGTRAFKQALTEPHCGTWVPPGLVKRTFKFKSGNVKVVALHAQAMVGYLKALRQLPMIEVTASFTSMYSGSYRTFDQQNDLYVAWERKEPGAHLAANPCGGYHRTGRAIDVLNGTSGEVEAAMTMVRVDGKRFFHGDVFGDPPHFSFGELG